MFAFSALFAFFTSGAALAQDSPPTAGPQPVPLDHTVLPYAQLLPPAVIDFTSTEPGTRVEKDTGHGWAMVCRMPCRAALDPSATYHIDGPGMTTSNELHFSPGMSSTVRVRPGSLPGRVGGIVATAIGGFVGVLGVPLYIAETSEGGRPGTGFSMIVLGGILLAVGIVAIVVTGTDVNATGTTVGRGFGPSPRGITF